MASDTPNPFARYRDGNPPTPGVFATAESVYANGTPVRIGDLIVNAGIGTERGLVVGVFGSFIAYLIDEADPQCQHSQVGGLTVRLGRCDGGGPRLRPVEGSRQNRNAGRRE